MLIGYQGTDKWFNFPVFLPFPHNTIIIIAFSVSGNRVYPYIAEKLSALCRPTLCTHTVLASSIFSFLPLLLSLFLNSMPCTQLCTTYNNMGSKSQMTSALHRAEFTAPVTVVNSISLVQVNGFCVAVQSRGVVLLLHVIVTCRVRYERQQYDFVWLL